MRYLTLFGTALLVAILAGCGSTGPTASYDASRNRMTYESANMTVASLDAAVGSGSSIVLRAVATCERRNCTPEAVQLIFGVQGQGQAAIADHSISIVADGNEYSWRGEQNWEQQGDISFSQEPVVRVALPLSSVEQIAKATTIEAYMGSMALNLEGRAQSKMQSFLQTIRNPSAAGTS